MSRHFFLQDLKTRGMYAILSTKHAELVLASHSSRPHNRRNSMRRRIAGSLPRLFNAIQHIAVNGDPAVITAPSLIDLWPQNRCNILPASRPAPHIQGMDTRFAIVVTSISELVRMKGGDFSIRDRLESIETWRIGPQVLGESA